MLNAPNFFLTTISGIRRDGRAASVGSCLEYATKCMGESEKLSVSSARSSKRSSPSRMRRRSTRNKLSSAQRELHFGEWSNKQ
uniref:Secreted protein n=1 Tax=Rhabditophanes sp. KR3021 TaxID=114890 RepID=A0AC35U7D3_9BILA